VKSLGCATLVSSLGPPPGNNIDGGCFQFDGIHQACPNVNGSIMWNCLKNRAKSAFNGVSVSSPDVALPFR
jgi:hypothetical protein